MDYNVEIYVSFSHIKHVGLTKALEDVTTRAWITAIVSTHPKTSISLISQKIVLRDHMPIFTDIPDEDQPHWRRFTFRID